MSKLDAYYATRHALETGDGLTWASNTILGKLIQKFSGHKVNHFGLVMRFRQYDEDRIFTLEALEPGIVLRALSERLRHHKGSCYWHPLKPEHHDKRVGVGASALSYVGVGYDYVSLFRQAAMRVSTDAGRLFCSEFGQICWEDNNIVPQRSMALQPGEMAGLGATMPPMKIL
jgi:hypothetical protein